MYSTVQYQIGFHWQLGARLRCPTPAREESSEEAEAERGQEEEHAAHEQPHTPIASNGSHAVPEGALVAPFDGCVGGSGVFSKTRTGLHR